MNWVRSPFEVTDVSGKLDDGDISATRLTSSGYSLSRISAVILHSVRMCWIFSMGARQRRHEGSPPWSLATLAELTISPVRNFRCILNFSTDLVSWALS